MVARIRTVAMAAMVMVVVMMMTTAIGEASNTYCSDNNKVDGYSRNNSLELWGVVVAAVGLTMVT